MLDELFAWEIILQILEVEDVKKAYPRKTDKQKTELAGMISRGQTQLDQFLKEHQPKKFEEMFM